MPRMPRSKDTGAEHDTLVFQHRVPVAPLVVAQQ